MSVKLIGNSVVDTQLRVFYKRKIKNTQKVFTTKSWWTIVACELAVCILGDLALHNNYQIKDMVINCES